ncbi:hypothetical protein Hanom_Chr16g01482031 [Helianthus anomalus]
MTLPQNTLVSPVNVITDQPPPPLTVSAENRGVALASPINHLQPPLINHLHPALYHITIT